MGRRASIEPPPRFRGTASRQARGARRRARTASGRGRRVRAPARPRGRRSGRGRSGAPAAPTVPTGRAARAASGPMGGPSGRPVRWRRRSAPDAPDRRESDGPGPARPSLRYVLVPQRLPDGRDRTRRRGHRPGPGPTGRGRYDRGPARPRCAPAHCRPPPDVVPGSAPNRVGRSSTGRTLPGRARSSGGRPAPIPALGGSPPLRSPPDPRPRRDGPLRPGPSAPFPADDGPPEGPVARGGGRRVDGRPRGDRPALRGGGRRRHPRGRRAGANGGLPSVRNECDALGHQRTWSRDSELRGDLWSLRSDSLGSRIGPEGG